MDAHLRVKVITTCLLFVILTHTGNSFDIKKENTAEDVKYRVRRGAIPYEQGQGAGGDGAPSAPRVGGRNAFDARVAAVVGALGGARDRQFGPGPGDQRRGPDQNEAPPAQPEQACQGFGARGGAPDVGGLNAFDAPALPWPSAGMAQPQQPQQPQSQHRAGPLRIAEDPACAYDVKRHCSKKGNNFAVLDCLQEVDNDISDECNHFLWIYKKNLTMDSRFENAAGEVCREEIRTFSDCSTLLPGKGEILPCLLDHSENITSTQCSQYLNRMKEITFSDWRLINGFYDSCQEDVSRLSCRVVNDNDRANQPTLPHSQGGTIHCLEKHIKDLATQCRLQILRVAELSSNDYHYDRSLYFACRDDRERLCSKVVAGDGRVYKCLKEHKFHPEMSDACKERLTTRQQVAAQDYKVNYRLFRKCKGEIKEAACTAGTVKTKEMKIATVLLCLGRQEKAGHIKISGDCKAELTNIRKELMSDYMINPELMKGCSREIEYQCKGLRPEGKNIHCLMGLAKQNQLSPDCKKALGDLVVEADAGSDYRLDVYLYNTCKDVKEKLCELKSDAETLSCLMEKIEHDEMTDDCAKRLLELQYFISRNFRLDPVLYKNCQEDAQEFCYEDFYKQSDLPKGLVFSCLHTHLHDPEPTNSLQPRCADQVHRVLRQRAVSVHLNPKIEEECRTDLGYFCNEKLQRGKEMQCLQEHMAELDTGCRRAVGNFTVEEAEDIQMNRKLIASCAPMLRKFCQEKLKAKKVDEGEALECLIENKNDDEMEPNCLASINHFQVTQLKDYRFSFKFKESCQKNVLAFCKGSRDKAAIVKCLSSKVRDSVLRGMPSPLDAECRAQLKYELLQRNENIDLDPELQGACAADIMKLCDKVAKGNARVTECLRSHQEGLSNQCHIEIFNREKEMASKPDIDYALMHACKNTIKVKCKHVAADKLIDCLKEHKDDPDTKPRCMIVLTQRQIERNSNIKLNPLLQKACRMDIPKFCPDLTKPDTAGNQEAQEAPDMEGKVIQCLREEFQKKESRLTATCSKNIRGVIKEGAEDYRLDRMLVKHCRAFIDQECAEEILQNPGSGHVEECLKTKIGMITDRACQQQVIGLFREGLADVHVDPLLYKACALDIKHYCAGIPQGQGQQMVCLLEALDQKIVRLQPDCHRMLNERKEMWEYAAQIAPIDGIMMDRYTQIRTSPQQNYFPLVCVSFIGIFFLIGLYCGRRSNKNDLGKI